MPKLLIVALLVVAAAAFASSPDAVFSGQIRIGSAAPHAFDVWVPVGGTERVLADGGYTLELSVPSFNKSIARLEDANGKVLHESTTIGPVQDRPSFIYQVCDGAVLFVSPVKNDLPACSE